MEYREGKWFHPSGLPLADGIDPAEIEAEIKAELADGTIDPRALMQITTRHRDAVLSRGFEWRGHIIQTRPADILNITGASALAIAAINAGAQRGDLRWANPDSDFVWLSASNARIPLDAYDMLDLGQALAAYRTRIIFTARAVKDAIAAGVITTRSEIGALIQ